jgi:multiple sugar transport system permease protein
MKTLTGPMPRAKRIRRRRGRVRRAGHQRAPWLFLAPSLIGLTLFSIWPMLRALYLSFTEYNIIQDPEWIGLDNYRRMAHDDQLTNAVRNTAVYATTTTVITILLALVLAALLNQKFRTRSFARASLFLPYMVSLSVIAIAWSFVLNPEIGVLAYWLQGLGIGSGQGILRDPDTAMAGVIAVGIWKNLGFFTVIYLAGIQSIPTELYDAAAIDGAGVMRRFRSITIPLLGNQTMLITVVATITNIQAFDQIYVMTQGGPSFRTDTMVNLIYRTGFEHLAFGYASALSCALAVVLSVLAFIQVMFLRRRAVAL